jgi:4-aminobutyrate aminotransferase / (S)-3-amino-2-methylpropionate transaminase / 5-aminovalerate transaminase
MLVMELVKDPVSKEPNMDLTAAITQAALQKGLIIIRAGLYSNCVRFLPPLNISDEQIDEGMAVLSETVAAVLQGV